MKIYIFIVLLCSFSVCDAAPRRRKTTTTSTTSATTTQPSTESPSCIDISSLMCEVAYKIAKNKKKFCYERGEFCCATCNGTFTTTSAATTTTTSYMMQPTSEPSDESPSCTDYSSAKCRRGYHTANDRMAFCTENADLCCETCKEFYSSQEK